MIVSDFNLMNQEKMRADDEVFDAFQYHPPSAEGVERQAELSARFVSIAHAINKLLPNGREKALVFTKLEEAKMWASAAVARNENTR